MKRPGESSLLNGFGRWSIQGSERERDEATHQLTEGAGDGEGNRQRKRGVDRETERERERDLGVWRGEGRELERAREG